MIRMTVLSLSFPSVKSSQWTISAADTVSYYHNVPPEPAHLLCSGRFRRRSCCWGGSQCICDNVSNVFHSPRHVDDVLCFGEVIHCKLLHSEGRFSINPITISRGGGMDQTLDSDLSPSNKDLNEKHSSHITRPEKILKKKNNIIWVLRVARNMLDRTANALGFRQFTFSTRVESELDAKLQELDDILDERHDQNLGRSDWLGASVSPPEEASSLKGWNRRSFRAWLIKIEHEFLSSDTVQALRTISKVLESFPDHGVVNLLGLYSPKDVILSIISLSRLQRVAEFYNSQEVVSSGSGTVTETNKNRSIDPELLDELSHYATFAYAAYGWKGLAALCGRLHFGGDNLALLQRTGIQKRDIILANWHSRTNRPAFFIARDVKRKTIILSIRGTMSPRDIITDLCASYENFLVEDSSDINSIVDLLDGDEIHKSLVHSPPIVVGRAHKGMVDAAKSIARSTGKVITDELKSNADYSLVIVGHSLGGGVAAVLTTMWQRRFHARIKSFGYGMPCVFPLNHDPNFLDQSDVIVSLIGEGDPFSTVSLGHIADLTNALSQLCQDRGLRDEILRRTHFGKRTALKDIPQQELNWSISTMTALRKQMRSEKLYPPGHIYFVTGPLTGKMERDLGRIHRVDQMQFNELKLHARMFDISYHIPARYEAVLRQALLDCKTS